jgi:hypothetical protein
VEATVQGFKHRWVALASVAIFFLSGCPSSENRTPTFPVSGKLLVNGQVAAGARIALHAVSDPQLKGLEPHAIVAADGSFRLTTFRSNDGAPAGTYAITVKWPSPPKPGQEQGPDWLQGRYAHPENPARKVEIVAGDNDLGVIELQ